MNTKLPQPRGLCVGQGRGKATVSPLQTEWLETARASISRAPCTELSLGYLLASLMHGGICASLS